MPQFLFFDNSSLNNLVTLILWGTVILLVVAIFYNLFGQTKKTKKVPSHKLNRHHKNPILSPLPHREWETNGTFNPAAIEDDDGRVHLFYRAIGDNGLSNIGHTSSSDGLHFDRRSPFPVYQPADEEKKADPLKQNFIQEYNPAIYTSGGGWGGHEDPRTVKIDGRVYMTYTAFQGWDSVRIALTSIALKDIKKERWNWKKPRMISPPNEVNKNWVLFPEKINGKYAILHSIVPNILIAYINDLDENFPLIQGKRLHGPQPGRKDFWDNLIRGPGAPPIKTDIGWLLLYHAQDNKESHKYKLGVMILDRNDPTKILYRSPEPILSPEMNYENDGKPGVIYASGSVVKNDQLFIYYGGGDKHVCVAQTPLEPLLGWLMRYGKV